MVPEDQAFYEAIAHVCRACETRELKAESVAEFFGGRAPKGWYWAVSELAE